uniref:Uncharacterized protein n=1 Tax=Anguilla anguilla TaxID=7936 RepID=A0A0E9TP53_ANGAN
MMNSINNEIRFYEPLYSYCKSFSSTLENWTFFICAAYLFAVQIHTYTAAWRKHYSLRPPCGSDLVLYLASTSPSLCR